MIVATAGHVDHGKTELVRALTGIDTDRLPEEKNRGLSIDLGFAYRPLSGQQSLGFVDVPGHEKFVRNMLAGVGGIDLGLLVVAADDGVMPQTREHFAILNLLGVERCLVAITKIDRVDDARIRQVSEQVEALVGRADVATFPVCAPDHTGIDALQRALEDQARSLPARATDGYFRMTIDRSFTLPGIGLVVTGMVFAGRAGLGDQPVVSTDGSPARIRGIRALDVARDQASAGERCALNITGRGLDERSLERGDWLLHPRLCNATRRIDVDLRVLATECRPLKHWSPVYLHLGAARIAARVAIIEGGSIAAGEQGLAQLVLEHDAFVVRGDRFVLRDPSARRTLAGGQVIDPFAPKRGRARPERIATLRAMNRRDSGAALVKLARISDTGVALEAFSIAGNLTNAAVDNLVAKLIDSPVDGLLLRRIGSAAATRLFSEDRWQALLERVEVAVEAFHGARPALPGASPEDIQQRLRPHTDRSLVEAACDELVRSHRLGRQGTRYHLPSHRVLFSESERHLLDRAAILLAPERGSPPSLHQAAEAMEVDHKALEALLKQAAKVGDIISIASNRYAPPAYLAQLANAAEALASSSAEGFSVAEYCAHTGIGRNFAIDLLEYFDRLGFTRRGGNRRRVLRPAGDLFAARIRQ